MKIDWSSLLEAMRHGPAFEPIERICGRVLFAGVILALFESLAYEVVSLTEVPDPVGIARVFGDGLLVLANPALIKALRVVLYVLLGLYIAGRGLPVVLPVIWIIIIGPATLSQSQGADQHSLQAAALVLTGQAVWALIWGVRNLRWSPEERRREREPFFRQLMWISLQIVVATYVVTGITKMWDSQGAWIKNAKYFPIQLEKARMAHYYNDLKTPGNEVVQAEGLARIPAVIGHEMAKRSYQFEEFLKNSPNWSRLFLTSGLLLEFGAILALLGRRWSLGLGLGLISFHLIISWMMTLNFAFNMYVLAIFLVNAPYWIGLGVKRLAGVSKA